MSQRGIPGMAGTEHIGFTVPDLEAATDFLVNILGCEEIYSVGPFMPQGDWMSKHLGVRPDTTMKQLRFFRCGNGSNFEVFEYSAPGQRTKQPLNSDVGGHHLAFYVEDLDAAVDFLHDNGVEVLGAPTSSRGASEGQRWVYFRAPWGMQFELVSFPGGKAYEASAAVKLWDPRTGR